MLCNTTQGKKEQKIKSFKLRITKISSIINAYGKSESKEIKYNPWCKVNEIRDKIAKINNVSPKTIKLFFKNRILTNGFTLLDYHIPYKRHPEIFYEIYTPNDDFSIKIYQMFPCPDKLLKIIDESLKGFTKGLVPKLLEDGTSGVYQIRGTDKEVIAIFKPIDEEPNTPNNPKGYVSKFGTESFRKGILSGEATIREEATYLVSIFGGKKMRFDVPETTFVEMSHNHFKKNFRQLEIMNYKENILEGGIIQNFLNENFKVKKKKKKKIVDKIDISESIDLINSNYSIPKKYGTFQKFADSIGVVADYSYSLFTVEEAHKIMILDFRILNCDRNDENILLVKKNKGSDEDEYYYKLIPIDHAYSFPSCLEIGDFELCWMSWSQANEPFTEKEKAYIESINIIEDMERLNKYINLRPDCWKYFRISNIVLKVGTHYNLTPFEIGSLLYHSDFDYKIPSKIKVLVEKTDKFSSFFKLQKRNRLFSWDIQDTIKGNKKKLEKKEEEEKNKIRKNSFFREKSVMGRVSSEPKKDILDSDESEEEKRNEKIIKETKEEIKKNGKQILKMNFKKKDNDSDKETKIKEDVFDFPSNQIYFQYFTIFLEELIHKEFPEKAKLVRNYNMLKDEFSELTLEEKNSTEIKE